MGQYSAVSKMSQLFRLPVFQTEVLHAPPISQLPKNILKASAHNPTDVSTAAAYAALPTPSATHPLRRPDQRFLDSEVFTNKFAAHLSGPLEKTTRRAMKRWSGMEEQIVPQTILTVITVDFAQDHAELGAALNGFSLNESGQLSAAIERTGQAVDATYMSTTTLVRLLSAPPSNSPLIFSFVY